MPSSCCHAKKLCCPRPLPEALGHAAAERPTQPFLACTRRSRRLLRTGRSSRRTQISLLLGRLPGALVSRRGSPRSCPWPGLAPRSAQAGQKPPGRRYRRSCALTGPGGAWGSPCLPAAVSSEVAPGERPPERAGQAPGFPSAQPAGTWAEASPSLPVPPRPPSAPHRPTGGRCGPHSPAGPLRRLQAPKMACAGRTTSPRAEGSTEPVLPTPSPGHDRAGAEATAARPQEEASAPTRRRPGKEAAAAQARRVP